MYKILIQRMTRHLDEWVGTSEVFFFKCLFSLFFKCLRDYLWAPPRISFTGSQCRSNASLKCNRLVYFQSVLLRSFWISKGKQKWDRCIKLAEGRMRWGGNKLCSYHNRYEFARLNKGEYYRENYRKVNPYVSRINRRKVITSLKSTLNCAGDFI